MHMERLPAGMHIPDDVYVLIEVAAGSSPVKYEWDKKTDLLMVDRFIPTPMFYPANYGFIPQTLSGDGDPCDAMVLTRWSLQPGCVVRCRPIGVLQMEDESGQDEKLLMVPVTKLDPFYENIASYTDLPKILIDQIVHFFEHYKDLEKNKWVKLRGFEGPDDARRIILEAYTRAKELGLE